MSAMTDLTATPPTVRFARRQNRGVMLGLSTLRVVSLASALAVLVVGLLADGILGAASAAVVWAPLVGGAFILWRGRPAVEWAPVVGQWTLRAANGQTRYRARVLTPRPSGTMALPGDAAALRFHLDPDTGACLIHDPHRQTLAAVVEVTHPAYVLLGPDQQHHRVAAWGRALAGLAQSGTCAAVQVLESTVADDGRRLVDWYETQGVLANGVGTGNWAADQYRRLLVQSTRGATTHRSTITLALDMRRAGRAIRNAGCGIKGAARVLRQDITLLEHSLRAADLRVERWLGEADLAGMIRHAYDPDLVEDFAPGVPAANLTHAGPTAIEEHWDCVRHDGGWSAVLWISEWPRIEVPAHFLHSLIFSPGVRKTLCLLARPLGTAEALRQIRREKTEMLSDAAQKAKIGQIADLSDAQELADVHARERALISGHADMIFAGFVTVTAPNWPELVAAVGQIERAAALAVCETRLLHGQQAQAFTVAALPLARSVF
jgi:Putative type VII ESX secretion system translocon, EccE